MPEPEVWLRGPIGGVPAPLQPVAHSLMQSREEVDALLAGLAPEKIWHMQNGAASIGFHVRHAMGSLDRLFTYARGALLSEAQRHAMAQESEANPDLAPEDLRAAFDEAVEHALDQLRSTDAATLTDVRRVGRAQLPSTLLGLLFHAAEHTQRHVGQAITTRKLSV